MKPLFLLSACGLALMSLAACGPRTPATARVALDCPSNQGDLRLSNVAPDKKTCTYVSRDGDEVSLRLIPVSTSYQAALTPIEAELAGEEAPAQPATPATPADPKAAKASASAAEKAAKEASADAAGADSDKDKDRDGDDHVSIGNGVVVADSGSHGDHANINLPGIHISADDDKANVNVGGVHVDAGEDGATVRMSNDVRLRGEAFSPERRGFRATYILAKDNLKDGWKAVGYEAAGPKAGPVTVAVFKAREGDHHVSEEVKRLVRRNAGV
jgi:hypothetical protein